MRTSQAADHRQSAGMRSYSGEVMVACSLQPMHLPLLDILRCVQPACEGRLSLLPVENKTRDGKPWLGLIGCRRCNATYPLIAGVPVILLDPHAWVACHRDSVLATLAEHGEASRTAVALVLELARSAGPMVQEPFADDWTASELAGQWPLPPDAATFGGHAFRAFLGEAEKRRPEDVLALWSQRGRGARGRGGWALDLGCGAGMLVNALSSRTRNLIASDRSLRAVLSARDVAPRASADACTVHGVVADATHLPIRKGALDTVVAAHLIDIVDAPIALLQACRRALKKRGALLLATPDPALVDGEPPVLDAWLEAADFEIERRDTVPWLRAHHGRHFQVYFSEVLMCRPGLDPL